MDKRIPARALIECILCARCNSYATATGGGICAACVLTAERDQLRAENAALCKVNKSHADYYEIREERDQLRNTVAGLRRALGEADRDCWRGYNDTRSFIDANVPNWTRGDDGPSFELIRNANKRKAALAASPDEHARRIKAESLREMANRLDKQCCECHDECIQDLRDEADRLESEATNG